MTTRVYQFTGRREHDVEHDFRLLGRHVVIRRTGWRIGKIFTYRCNGQHP